jgi:hypothetical protein
MHEWQYIKTKFVDAIQKLYSLDFGLPAHSLGRGGRDVIFERAVFFSTAV